MVLTLREHLAMLCFGLNANANSSRSSIVLWVSQNIEDDYTYNLAL